MFSGEGEGVPFCETLYPTGNVEDWLLEVERVMRGSLKKIIEDSLINYKEVCMHFRSTGFTLFKCSCDTVRIKEACVIPLQQMMWKETAPICIMFVHIVHDNNLYQRQSIVQLIMYVYQGHTITFDRYSLHTRYLVQNGC